ncbi:hypothetical protein K7640_05100 [Micromonospora sp. PLK6-60]|uniref:hypothetical protein n=1 Tax=Micromonospora sp. PLK6-60 TaxID=2873383 RepID=UPI001CA6ECAA|nr:hypothetical protein [Micromonospora sp. PLK6-60]MBY8871223.1 hypothetical protein [Micromonospora sp. PLK6-60]
MSVATTPAVPRAGFAPRWAVRVAHLIPLLVLPSGLWRIALVVGLPIGVSVHGVPIRPGLGESLYIVSLSLVSEGLALLSLGLVRPWGQVLPHWLPLVGGRRVPPWFAVSTATTGAVALTLIWGYAAWGVAVNGNDLGLPPAGFALLATCYAPLLLWGPLLLLLALNHHHRRPHPR